MSADLHIITFDPKLVSIDIVREYVNYDLDFSLSNEALLAANDRQSDIMGQLYGPLYNSGLQAEQPWVSPLLDNAWIGQVSYAKADLFGEGTKAERLATWRRYVPRAVEYIQQAYQRQGGVVQLTPAFAASLMPAFNLLHDSMYEDLRNERGGRQRQPKRYRISGVARARDIKTWLNANMGAYSFADTW